MAKNAENIGLSPPGVSVEYDSSQNSLYLFIPFQGYLNIQLHITNFLIINNKVVSPAGFEPATY